MTYWLETHSKTFEINLYRFGSESIGCYDSTAGVIMADKALQALKVTNSYFKVNN